MLKKDARGQCANCSKKCACSPQKLLTKHSRGTPGAMSSGQGSVFGSDEYVSPPAGTGIPQGMDGKARRADNVGIERWFRTPKGERPRNAGHSTPRELEMEMAGFAECYNNERTHQLPGYETPASWCCGGFLMAA